MTARPERGAEDRRWMEQALALGAVGEGATSPNPRVGCILVRDGRMVGRGFHQAPGLPHAEANAVTDAGDDARGATAYVNLEPCAHHGRTPPCADLLIRSGVRRVVSALRDPNPLVNGQGFARLREAGVEVEVGLLEDCAEKINAAFLHRHRTGRPLVTLKAASSLDGMIAASDGRSKWISGEPARRFAHRLRLRHDAVLVGAGTVRRDNPRLTVRLAGPRTARLRVVLAPSLNVDPASAVFGAGRRGDPATRIYTTSRAPKDAESAWTGRAEIVRVPESDDGLDLHAVLKDLAGAGVHSVLVEGGARTMGSFLEAGLADRAALFYARTLLGSRGGTPLVDGHSVSEPSAGWRLLEPCQLALGEDLLLLGRLAAPERPSVAGG